MVKDEKSPVQLFLALDWLMMLPEELMASLVPLDAVQLLPFHVIQALQHSPLTHHHLDHMVV